MNKSKVGENSAKFWQNLRNFGEKNILRHVVEIETNPKGNERREKKTPLDTIARRFEL